MPHIGGLGLTGVWLAGPVADGLASLITGIIFFRSVRGLKEAKEPQLEVTHPEKIMQA